MSEGRYVMALTYEPKIDEVREGSIRQTIRPWNRRLLNARRLLIHGWEGRPYRSKWSWRLDVEVESVQELHVTWGGWRWAGSGWVPWSAPASVELARLDGIKPATGFELRDVLTGLNPRFNYDMCYLAVRWLRPETEKGGRR